MSRQQRCAAALDEHRKQLSKEDRRDLTMSQTTLTSSGELDAARNLWFVPTEILDVCPVPDVNRLHPELSQHKVLKGLCQPFNVAKWIQEVTTRLETDDASERERISLY